jgi:glutamate/tyrosine decarboxylase-like PLP-dependent enzyme
VTDTSASDLAFARPLFLGPAAENDQLFESLVVEFLRDHSFWRRNFHPEDGQRIDAGARNDPDFLAFQAETRRALYQLSAELKRAVHFFHPRYVGHMSSDLLLPGLVAKILTTLYNPNNVSEEAAPQTLEKELQVGEQLARMFGYTTEDATDGRAERDDAHGGATEQSAGPFAWGHLTSGGTVANYEALWNFRSVKFYPLALQAGAREINFDPVAGPLEKPFGEYTKWELLNLTMQETIALRRQLAGLIDDEADPAVLRAFRNAVRSERIESLGTAAFFLKHHVTPPVVLVSASAHYSWEKGMKVLGFGTQNLIRVDVDDHMRMDLADLGQKLETAFAEHVPVLAVVGMLGTTEFGTVDPIHGIVAARDRARTRRLDFGIHVDGAWGGYLTSVFRAPDGSFLPRDSFTDEFAYFPSETVHAAFEAIADTDSVTVDPHKLGYIPYAAGAFVARDRDVVDFIAQQAAYVFDLGDREHHVPRREQLHKLGQYILEGSKPGAAAAAVHVTHQVLPLDTDGMGRLVRLTLRSCERFWDSARVMADRLEDRVTLVVPFEPDSNLICLALNPAGNRDLARMNAFSRDVFSRMRVDPERPVQAKTFIGSYTSLQKGKLSGGQANRILGELGIDPATFVSTPEDGAKEADHIYLLRHTLMNPWLLDGPGGRTYIDLYWEYLEGVIDELLPAYR